MGFEPTTPGLKVRWPHGLSSEPLPDTESGPQRGRFAPNPLVAYPILADEGILS